MTVKIDEHIMKNLIYSEDTESFTIRLFHKLLKKSPISKLELREMAWEVIKEMNKERHIIKRK